MRKDNLVGQQFGKLTVVESENRNGRLYWVCRCECGGKNAVRGYVLKSGKVKSCGCSQFEPRLHGDEASFRALYRGYKNGANHRNLDFGLTPDEFRSLTSLPCFYCGIEPQQSWKKIKNTESSYIYNGIDRLDNEIGYFIDNCVPCCGVCNFMKQDLSKDVFLAQVYKIAEHTHGGN